MKAAWTTLGFALAMTALAHASPSVPLHPGDSVSVTVFNHPELSSNQKVSAEGTVSLPLAGTVRVSQLTPSQASSRIVDALRKYLRHPAVEVGITGQGQSIFVTGSYQGLLTYQPGETLTSAISELSSKSYASAPAGSNLSGDTKQNAIDFKHSGVDLKTVKLVRDGKTMGPYDVQSLNSTGSPGPSLVPGDTIAFSSKPVRVQLLGEVRDPGAHFLDVNEPISQAIADAGGLLPTASTRVMLERGGTTTPYALGSQTISQLPAQNGDAVTIKTAPRVNVVGIVASPSPVILRDDTSLLSAIYLAGGPTRRADLKNIKVMQNGTQAQYNIQALTHGDTSQNPSLTDGAVVFVPQQRGFDPESILQALGALSPFARF